MNDRMPHLRVLIVDDQALIRAGFAMIIEAQPDMTVVGDVADGEAALAAVRRLRPDVVLMDVRMPGTDGIEATRRLLQADAGSDRRGSDANDASAGARPRVIILTTFDLDEYVFAALRAGASGFLLKDVTPERLVQAVRMVMDGDALLAPSVTRRLVERFAQPQAGIGGSATALSTLTARERDVFQWLARGSSNGEIADELVLSEATVKTHVAGILGKLDLRNRAQAVVFAYEAGVVRVGDAAADPAPADDRG